MVSGKAERKGGWDWGPVALISAFLLTVSFSTGCEEENLSVPSAGKVESAYLYGGGLSATVTGNVAEVTIVQASQQIQRGGALWARVGPYVFLFSKETEGLFREYPGLAAIRAVTVTPDGTEVARALLTRNELNDITWRRALNISGLARRDGTRRPTLLEDLVRWGEDHTEFNYNPRFSSP